MTRHLWALLAWVSLALGIIGAFLPVMPTVPFVLLSAFAAARGSERLHVWLIAHPGFGPMIRDWQAYGAVSRKAKWAATVTMLACAGVLLAIMLLTGSHRAWMVALPITCMVVVGTWLWLRPEPPEPPAGMPPA